MAGVLLAGVARADITPAVGIPMVGFAGRGPSTDARDPLYATCLALQDGDGAALLLQCDLLQLRAETVAEIRRHVTDATGVPASRIMLSCTHTHYGPSVDRDELAIVDAYRAHLAHQLAGVASEAMGGMVEASLGVAWGECDIAINRRERVADGSIRLGNNPDGPVDRSLGVARIETSDGEPLACLVNFACHPVSQGGRMQSLSAGFPGSAREVVEELTGAHTLYLQGACGDLNPIIMEHAYEPARTLGVRLGCSVVDLWERIAPSAAEGLATAQTTEDLPRYMYGSQDAAVSLAEELTEQLARLQAAGGNEGGVWWAKLRRDRVSQAADSWASGDALESVSAEMQALRLGGLALVSAPAEIFTENGALVKRESPIGDTFFLGYTNGSIGYVPTRDAYPEGGYEVTHACQVDPDAGDTINEACLRVLREVAL
jgi:neutral ceramidase